MYLVKVDSSARIYGKVLRMAGSSPLIPKHGAYRKLKSFQLAQLVYDLTVHFCEQYVPRSSRTKDQMVQAARSGVQNIAEGSQASGTSKKTELKLTNVARASLEELRLDYEDFLRQRGLMLWEGEHPCMVRFKERRVSSLMEFRQWVAEELRLVEGKTDLHGRARTDTDNKMAAQHIKRPDVSLVQTLAANGALSLLNLTCYLLDRQIASQARAFEMEGGFTERLYKVRSEYRKKQR